MLGGTARQALPRCRSPNSDERGWFVVGWMDLSGQCPWLAGSGPPLAPQPSSRVHLGLAAAITLVCVCLASRTSFFRSCFLVPIACISRCRYPPAVSLVLTVSFRSLPFSFLPLFHPFPSLTRLNRAILFCRALHEKGAPGDSECAFSSPRCRRDQNPPRRPKDLDLSDTTRYCIATRQSAPTRFAGTRPRSKEPERCRRWTSGC